MFQPTETQVVPTEQLQGILAGLIAVDGPLDAVKLMLWVNNIVPDKNTVLADLTVPTFTGYAAFGPVVWGSVMVDVDGTAIVTGASHEFVCTGGTPTDIIYGWALTNSGGTTLIKAARLAAPVPIGRVGSGIAVVPWFRYSGT